MQYTHIHFAILTEILQRFFDEFCWEAEVVGQLQARRLYSPVCIGVTCEVSDGIGMQGVTW